MKEIQRLSFNPDNLPAVTSGLTFKLNEDDALDAAAELGASVTRLTNAAHDIDTLSSKALQMEMWDGPRATSQKEFLGTMGKIADQVSVYLSRFSASIGVFFDRLVDSNRTTDVQDRIAQKLAEARQTKAGQG